MGSKMEANRGTQCRFSLSLFCHSYRQIKGINDDDCNPTLLTRPSRVECEGLGVIIADDYRAGLAFSFSYHEGESVPSVIITLYGMSRRLSTPAKERLVLIKRQEV